MTDITETLFARIQSELGDGADAWLAGATVDKASLDEACSIFPDLPEDEVRAVLRETSSNVDKAIPLLFERDSERRRRQQRDEKVRLMEDAFSALPKSVVQEILRKHDGDISASSAELLRIMQEKQDQEEQELVSARKEATRKMQDQNRQTRNRFIDHCVKTFDSLARDEIVAVVGTGEVDVPRIVARLTELSNDRKLRNLASMFSRTPQAHVEATLVSCGFDMQAACEALSAGQAVESNEVSTADVLERTVFDAINVLDGASQNDSAAEAVVQDLLRRAVGPVNDQVASAPSANQQQLDALADQKPAEEGLRVRLDTDATVYALGAPSIVRIMASGGAVSTYDWVTLHSVDASDTAAPLTWQWYQPTLTFALPAHGRYQLRYMRKSGGGVHVLARSADLLCGPVVALDVRPGAEGAWNVTWATPDAGCEPVASSAWVGLYDAACTDDSQYLAFHYVSLESRTLIFKAPRTNGRYEFRFFASRFGRVSTSAIMTVAHSDSITVLHDGSPQLTVSLTLSSANLSRYWVGIFHQNEERHKNYRRYDWVTQSAQQFSFKTPVHAGTYEARVYDAKNVVVVKSAPFVVV